MIRCTPRSSSCITMLAVSTRNGMSSLTISTIVWGQSQPSLSLSGLKIRIKNSEGFRFCKNSSCPVTIPANISGVSRFRFANGIRLKYTSLKNAACFAALAGIRLTNTSLTCSSSECLLLSLLVCIAWPHPVIPHRSESA